MSVCTSQYKDLPHRTFPEAKRIWKDHSYSWMKFGICFRRIPITDWVTHYRTSQKVHLNPFLEYSATFMSCEEGTLFKLRMFSQANWLKLVGEYIDQTFISFLSDFIWSSQYKTIAHCLSLSCIKQGTILQNITSCNSVPWMYLSFKS